MQGKLNCVNGFMIGNQHPPTPPSRYPYPLPAVWLCGCVGRTFGADGFAARETYTRRPLEPVRRDSPQSEWGQSNHGPTGAKSAELAGMPFDTPTLS
jgi:hypothetical protein